MHTVFRKLFLASLLALMVLATGAWQSEPVALARQEPGSGAAPLAPGLTWASAGGSAQTLRTSVDGDVLSLLGERFEAAESFPFAPPQDVLEFYSNEQLATLGWESYDAFEDSNGTHAVFANGSGRYLAVESLQCPEAPSSVCLSVWVSEPVDLAAAAAADRAPEPDALAAASTFGKISPVNGATNVDPASVTLSWSAYSPTPNKYSYCIKEGSACPKDDPNWTSTYDRNVTVKNLAFNKTYYWQVKAITCITCVPKTYVLADNGVAWTFHTKSDGRVTILGNAGVAGAALTYFDGTSKTVTSDTTGSYSLRVPLHWSGTLTPSKAGYRFSPKSVTFNNLTSSLVIQNFVAIPVYTISGSTGVAGVTLSYVDGTPQTVVSGAGGAYSIAVPAGWSGTITPSKPSYTFTPANRSYANVTSNLTAQNFVATYITYVISGDAGVAGATLTYMDGGPRFVVADSGGNYSIVVPIGWSGSVKPNKIGYSFSPVTRTYANVQANQSGQNYAASVCASCVEKDTVGVFRPGNGLLYLKNGNYTGYADISINYGLAGDYPVVGDWDGDGDDTIGVYRNGSFYLRNSNTVGNADLVFSFGQPGDQPLAGDWDGDGIDTVGVYRRSTGQFLLRNSNSAGAPDIIFSLGNVGDLGLAGDWNGDGIDTTGVFRPSNGVIFLKNTHETGFADIALNYGLPGDRPIAGDWNNNGVDTIGVYRNGVFYLRNSNSVGFADIILGLGLPGDMPLAGNWDDKP